MVMYLDAVLGFRFSRSNGGRGRCRSPINQSIGQPKPKYTGRESTTTSMEFILLLTCKHNDERVARQSEHVPSMLGNGGDQYLSPMLCAPDM